MLYREENLRDNIKHHGQTLLEKCPEDGLKRSGFCTKLYLYKMPWYEYTEALSTTTVACSNKMSKEEPMLAIYRAWNASRIADHW